jgi:hypothetical protein
MQHALGSYKLPTTFYLLGLYMQYSGLIYRFPAYLVSLTLYKIALILLIPSAGLPQHAATFKARIIPKEGYPESVEIFMKSL